VAEGGRVVLILIPAGDLVDALADERVEGMGAGLAPPVREMGGNLGTDARLGIGTSEPGQPAVRGEMTAIEGGFEGEGGEGFKGEGGCGRISHEEASFGGSVIQHHDHTERGFFFTTPGYE